MKKSSSKLFSLLLSTVLLLIGFYIPSAQADEEDTPQNSISWQVQPSGPNGPGDRPYFIYDLKPGQSVTDVVAITNFSEQEINLNLLSTDALNAPTGDFDLLESAAVPVAVGAWITLETDQVTVGPRETVNVNFTISVPESATPGDHVGGVVTSLPSLRVDSNGQQVLVDARVAARVYLSVDGQINPSLKIEDLKLKYDNALNPADGKATVTANIVNDGNIRLTGAYSVFINGPSGLKLKESDQFTLPEILPGQSHEIEVNVGGIWSLFQVEAALELTPLDNSLRIIDPMKPSYASDSVIAIPWLFVIVFLILLTAICLIIYRQRQKRAKARAVTENEKSAPEDSEVAPIAVETKPEPKENLDTPDA